MKTKARIKKDEIRLFAVLGDIGALHLATFSCLSLYGNINPHFVGTARFLLWSLVLSCIWLTYSFIIDLYYARRLPGRVSTAWLASRVAALTSLTYLFLPYVTPEFPDRRLWLFALPIASAALVGLWRVSIGLLLRSPERYSQKVILLGNGKSAMAISKFLGEIREDPHAARTHDLLGIVTEPCQVDNGMTILGSTNELCEICSQYSPDELVFSNEFQPNESELAIILSCHEKGIQITSATRLFEELSGRLPLELVPHRIEFLEPFLKTPHARLINLIKRIIDISAGLAGILLLIFVTPAVYLLNLIYSRGPLFFSQIRVGRGGKNFRVYKFRSMVVDAERKSGAVFASENDPRITKLGNFLRKSRIDELPQFWNVLKGEMSLIGPRPERPEFVDSFNETLPFYKARHSVKPGLTGWAQVKYRYGASTEDTARKLEYDLYYIKHQSIFLDYIIALLTVQVVLGRKGR